MLTPKPERSVMDARHRPPHHMRVFADFALDLQHRFDAIPPYSELRGVKKRTLTAAIGKGGEGPHGPLTALEVPYGDPSQVDGEVDGQGDGQVDGRLDGQGDGSTKVDAFWIAAKTHVLCCAGAWCGWSVEVSGDRSEHPARDPHLHPARDPHKHLSMPLSRWAPGTFLGVSQ